MAGCNDGAQQATWCPTSTDEVLPSVLGLLPPGPAWDGAQQDGTVMNMFWRSISNLTGWVYGRLCAYMNEFYCHTVVESLDQWQADYGLPNSCDPYGNNLCAQVTAIGGQDFATYEALARSTGWVITFQNMREVINEPYCGCMMAGSVQCSTVPVVAGRGSNIGYGDMRVGVGTALSVEQDAEANPNSIVFETASPTPSVLVLDPADSTGNFTSWGQMFTWIATVDLQASYALQGITYVSPTAPPISNAGNFTVGCTQLCAENAANFALCWLDQIAPAHTVLITKVAQ